jgi:4'-phosphopantetheinyl transferase EntD
VTGAGLLIDAILPAGVAAAECFDDPPEVRLLPAEEESVRKAVDKRRREFGTVRHCARRALAELGQPPVAILPGPDREPQWPAGIVGSMTHCDGYRAAAVARDVEFASIGIDAEPNAPLPDGVLGMVTRPEEIPRLSALGARFPAVHWDRLLFSAKESVYKTWFPLARCWLGFEEASLDFDPTGGTFTAALHRTGLVLDGQPIAQLTGRWLVRNGLVITAVSLASAGGAD